MQLRQRITVETKDHICQLLATLNYRDYVENLHSDDTVVRITSNMEPCAWINQSGIPTLQHTVSIFKALTQTVQSITYHWKYHNDQVLATIYMPTHLREYRHTYAQKFNSYLLTTLRTQI
jgi:hypothetical protein